MPVPAIAGLGNPRRRPGFNTWLVLLILAGIFVLWLSGYDDGFDQGLLEYTLSFFLNHLLLILLFIIAIILMKSDFLWLEVLLSLCTVALLSALLASEIPGYLKRAQVSELFSLLSGMKTDSVEYYAVHGQWPETGEGALSGVKTEGKYSHDARLEGGALSVGLKESDERLSLRPAVPETPPYPFVLWLCGYRQPPAGYVAVGDNHTNLPPSLLPHVCRNQRVTP